MTQLKKDPLPRPQWEPKGTQAQARGLWKEADLLFLNGPAGTGKTFLAIALAMEALASGRAEKLYFCRPAVDAGESLGYLPGDKQEKMEPYLAPAWKCLKDQGYSPEKLIRQGYLEVVPLAYQRGWTFSGIAILDEAQNCTFSQLKMFLTRLGEHSKVLVSGDPTQSDLPRGISGLSPVLGRLLGADPKIKVWRASAGDNRRHPLVEKILKLTEDW